MQGHQKNSENKNIVVHYTVSDSCFCFSFYSVQGGNSTDVNIHSSEVKMYSADVKMQVIIGTSKFPGLFTVHFFGSVQMVMVSKNHGYKWFAVMDFTLSRLEHGWFRENSVCCGPVHGPWLSLRFGYGAVYDSRLSLRVGFGPVCIQHLSSRTATSPMPSTLGMHSPLRTNSSIFLHPPSPQQPPLVPIAHPGGIGCVFLAAQQ